MPKSKVITNQTPKVELQEKVNEIVEEVPQEKPVPAPILKGPRVVPPVEPPTTAPEEEAAPVTPPQTVTEEESGEELDLTSIKAKDPNELTDEEQTFLEEHQEELTPQEKLNFNIIETLPENPVVPETPADNTDWKARYAGSTREAQVLASKNKQVTDAITKAGELPEPTDEEMRTELGDDWDIMDDTQRRIARRATLADRRFEIINKASQEGKKTDEWVDRVRTYSQDPQVVLKFPQIEGREIEFVQFCSLPSRVGVDLEDLVKAFTFDIKPVEPKRQNLFERGTGGHAPAQKEMTVEEISFLRTNNPKKYKELIKSGKIKIEI